MKEEKEEKLRPSCKKIIVEWSSELFKVQDFVDDLYINYKEVEKQGDDND